MWSGVQYESLISFNQIYLDDVASCVSHYLDDVASGVRHVASVHRVHVRSAGLRNVYSTIKNRPQKRILDD